MSCLAQTFVLVAIATCLGFILTILSRSRKLGTRGGTTAPRLGGAAIFLGLCLSLAFQAWHSNESDRINYCSLLNIVQFDQAADYCDKTLLWLLIFTPVFIIGLAEDIANGLSVRLRFWAAVCMGFTLTILGGERVVRLDIPGVAGLDDLGQFGYLLSVTITSLAIAGYTHAMNIIDGLHGFASGASIFMFLGLGLIAIGAGDIGLANISFLLCALTLGFFAVNFPKGSVFLGDSGAYLLGFFAAAVAIAIPYRHEQVSPWASLLICAYPVIEVCFSILRRLGGRKRSPGRADHLHLHSLLYRRGLRSNPKASVILLIPIGLGVAIAVLAAENALILQISFVVAVWAYLHAYRKLIRPFRDQ
jgi:UDP-N-acetylmuramyl pentapeptide phosphotransferase/UDP-N-acetylglucosamine-1-phosphate transferase